MECSTQGSFSMTQLADAIRDAAFTRPTFSFSKALVNPRRRPKRCPSYSQSSTGEPSRLTSIHSMLGGQSWLNTMSV